MADISQDVIRAYALKNAIEHNGVAVVGSVLSPLFHEGLEKKDVKSLMPTIQAIITEVNTLSKEAQKIAFKTLEENISRRSEREGLPELPNAVKGKVVTRFAPSPSGPMHIGHAATGLPSSLYATEYEGTFIVRIEDTNPDNIYEPAYEMIQAEGDWLFGNVATYLIQSDRMAHYYKYLERFIKEGHAYVCTCDVETFKTLVTKSKACPCRKHNAHEHTDRYNNMQNKKGYKEGEVVVRFKSDLNHTNPALRDFPIARINETRHPRQGTKYRVWPLMNLSVFVDDLETKVTHAIRAKEHQDNGKRQEIMFAAVKKHAPTTIYLGRYNFTDLEISATKTKEKIAHGDFDGWDDIRLPFLGALKKRGFVPEAFKDLAVQRGLSGVDKKLTHHEYFTLLAQYNRAHIKDTAITLEYKEDTKKGFVTVRMPSGKTRKLGTTEKLKNENIYFLKGIGYARYNKDDDELWFAHE